MKSINCSAGLPADLAKYNFWGKLADLPFIKRIFLFGSRARGDAGAKSDIDIAIDCPGASERQWALVLDVIEQADTLLTIDVVRYDTLRDSVFKEKIDQSKRVLYES